MPNHPPEGKSISQYRAPYFPSPAFIPGQAGPGSGYLALRWKPATSPNPKKVTSSELPP